MNEFGIAEQVTDRNLRLAVLVGVDSVPTREGLILEMVFPFTGFCSEIFSLELSGDHEPRRCQPQGALLPRRASSTCIPQCKLTVHSFTRSNCASKLSRYSRHCLATNRWLST